MTPQQIRDYIRAALGQSPQPSLFSIVQTLARVAGINAQSAVQHVVEAHQDLAIPLSTEASRGLFKQALDLDTKTSYQQYGSFPQVLDVDTPGTLPSDPSLSAQDAFAGQTFVPEPRTQAQQWSSFMAGRPGLPEALRGGAARLRPQIETQFGLQPSVSGTDPIQSFRDFLSGGQFLTGQDLQQRLGSVASAVRAPIGSFFPNIVGTGEEDPYGRLMIGLQNAFQEPLDAFSAFTQPYLQGAGTGRARRLVESGFDRWFQGYMGRNPAATSGDVASIFGI